MDLRGEADVPAEGAAVAAIVRDLSTYPEWLRIVEAAMAEAEGAWNVDLVAKLGPLRRSKRVRMKRLMDDPDRVVFERAELDARQHSTWRLSVQLKQSGEATTVAVHLHYSGAPSLPLVELLLRDEMKRAGARLEKLVTQR